MMTFLNPYFSQVENCLLSKKYRMEKLVDISSEMNQLIANAIIALQNPVIFYQFLMWYFILSLHRIEDTVVKSSLNIIFLLALF